MLLLLTVVSFQVAKLDFTQMEDQQLTTQQLNKNFLTQ